MDLGWTILTIFLVVEALLVTVLCLPMPSNDIRGMINTFVASLWDARAVQYAAVGLLVLDVVYFTQVFHALSNPLYDLGWWNHEMGVSCEYKQDLYLAERNAYITGCNLFLFFVLRRLVDIQDKLHIARGQVKSISGGKQEQLLEGEKTKTIEDTKKDK